MRRWIEVFQVPLEGPCEGKSCRIHSHVGQIPHDLLTQDEASSKVRFSTVNSREMFI